jgi:glycosyltransferase involved in cell wall biosynthesis
VHIVHLIGTLERGGAELFLRRLCRGLAQLEPSWTQAVWVLGARGSLADDFDAAGVAVRPFGLTKSPAAACTILRLVAALRASRASVLQTWMYHADAVGIAAHLLGVRIPQVWSLRQSNLAADVNRADTRAVIKACALASSRVPAVVVAGSAAALEAHRAIGYRAAHFPVIHNGVDTGRFRPDQPRRSAVRRAWGLADDTLVFGYLARFSPVKGHDVLLDAAARFGATQPTLDWRLVLVGEGASLDDPAFAAGIARRGLKHRVLAPGAAAAPETVLPGFDIAVSSSLGEGFPNGVAEAMAAGLPIVATDVGDTRQLVGDTGWIVAPGDAAAVAEAMREAAGAGTSGLGARGEAARYRVEHHFREIDAVRAYAALYRTLRA